MVVFALVGGVGCSTMDVWVHDEYHPANGGADVLGSIHVVMVERFVVLQCVVVIGSR